VVGISRVAFDRLRSTWGSIDLTCVYRMCMKWSRTSELRLYEQSRSCYTACFWRSFIFYLAALLYVRITRLWNKANMNHSCDAAKLYLNGAYRDMHVPPHSSSCGVTSKRYTRN
jgi:hypothetical protein